MMQPTDFGNRRDRTQRRRLDGTALCVNAREVKHKVLGARESHVGESIECSRGHEIDARALSRPRRVFMAASPWTAGRHVSRGAPERRRRGDYAGAAPTATAICRQVGSQG